jgi:hypothetical protein
VRDTTLLEAAGINRKTGTADERLLANLLVVESIPAWTSSRLKRPALSPKRYVIDPAIAAAVLGLDVDLVMRSGCSRRTLHYGPADDGHSTDNPATSVQEEFSCREASPTSSSSGVMTSASPTSVATATG